MSNYRPIANLSFISKLTEKIVEKRLLDHLTSNSLLNPFQSAYTKFYSTETTLLSLHNHLSNDISTQQVSCLYLLDLSAAFNTLEHPILLHRLSIWFGISSVSLQWFTLYLLFRISTVEIPPHSPPSSPLTCEVPHDFVLGPVLFNLYTTPLSSLISASSIFHLLYADDTHILVSFVPTNFFVCHKQPSVQYITSRLGCLLIILLTIAIKQNYFLSIFHSKSLK